MHESLANSNVLYQHLIGLHVSAFDKIVYPALVIETLLVALMTMCEIKIFSGFFLAHQGKLMLTVVGLTNKNYAAPVVWKDILFWLVVQISSL